MSQASDNAAFAAAAQRWLGIKEDSWAGVSTMAAFLAKTGQAPAATPVPAAGAMRTSPRGLDLIHSFESCRLTAYADPGSRDGRPHTIGWGSTGPDIHLGLTWTQQQADARFAADLTKFEKGVLTALGGSPVTQGQFDALVSFSYNVGTAALASSTLLKLHKAGDYAGARQQFSRWNKNDGVEMKGLTRRRAAEAALYGAG